ncbi:hypothetical protein SAMN04487771_101340 [[Clostridium] aminophilum]|uniref:Uncharacterized protein n=1 Tax=[Clostridium] aminophilum TaxID=1526 RepID=A0A1I0DNL1_9FIRM|nr:hypothetical protein [[Clostridium] aminophilum]SET33935.1 hypothetical protein SAMN04487771_101340 [[Clostridium] aminophilum]
MTNLLVLKENLKAVYARWSIVIDPAVRFLLALMSLLFITRFTGYQDKLGSILLIVLTSAGCAFLPTTAITAVAGFFLLVEFFALSLEVTVITFTFILIVMLLLFGFQPDSIWLILLAPLVLFAKMPLAMAVLVGLSGTLVSVIPMSCGIFVYYLIMYVRQNSSTLTEKGEVREMSEMFSRILRGVLSNPEMIVMLIAVCITMMVTLLLRRLSVNYVWEIAIAGGLMAGLIVILAGSYSFSLSVSLPLTAVSVAVSVLVAMLYRFLRFSADYGRTEFLQYEDEDYYYYVKAVPKVNVARTDVRVQKINKVHRR